jgi:hypothetical protein
MRNEFVSNVLQLQYVPCFGMVHYDYVFHLILICYFFWTSTSWEHVSINEAISISRTRTRTRTSTRTPPEPPVAFRKEYDAVRRLWKGGCITYTRYVFQLRRNLLIFGIWPSQETRFEASRRKKDASRASLDLDWKLTLEALHTNQVDAVLAHLSQNRFFKTKTNEENSER